MAVLNTTSPTLAPAAPILLPRNIVPSARASRAGAKADGSGKIAGKIELLSGYFLVADAQNQDVSQTAPL
jgi:hypothetical protein